MSKLKYRNTDSAISREILQAPSKLFVREAIKNCIEAIGSEQNGRIEVVEFDPSILGHEFFIFNNKKLCIWNNKAGLSRKELHTATDLSSSINKINSLNENFGRGIKVTALSCNRTGFIWLSCKDGVVSLAWLRKTDTEEYERFDFYENIVDAENIAGDSLIDILDISDITLPWSKTEDWNAYIFCGNNVKQNTIERPFDSEQKETSAWFINSIYERFYHWPNNIDLILDVGHSKGRKAKVKFTSVEDTLKKLSLTKSDDVKIETVIDEQSGLEITYIFDGEYTGESAADNQKPTSTVGNPATGPGFVGFTYKGELYDVQTGNQLKATARMLGIPFGAKFLRVIAHLPVRPKEYENDSDRQYVRRNNIEKSPIQLVDYAYEIKMNMPNWFVDKINEYIPSIGNANIKEELTKFAETLKIYDKSGGNIGNTNGGFYNGTNSVKNVNSKVSKVASNSKRRTGNGNRIATIVAPNIVELFTAQDVKSSSAESIEGRAAQYDIDTHTLYLNYTYKTIEGIIESLTDEYIKHQCFDDLSSDITNFVREKFGIKVGISILLSVQKKSVADWKIEDIETSVAPSTLSVVADQMTLEYDSYSNYIAKRSKELASIKEVA